tara:strand:- start:2084 stop:2344 length:261 start_codon:yes stop_codon:yes gene_type:complete
MMQLREEIVRALIQKFEGEIASHKINVEIMLENTVGVGEHPNIIETIEQELEKMSTCEDKLSVLQKHFMDKKSKDSPIIKKELLND